MHGGTKVDILGADYKGKNIHKSSRCIPLTALDAYPNPPVLPVGRILSGEGWRLWIAVCNSSCYWLSKGGSNV